MSAKKWSWTAEDNERLKAFVAKRDHPKGRGQALNRQCPQSGAQAWHAFPIHEGISEKITPQLAYLVGAVLSPRLGYESEEMIGKNSDRVPDMRKRTVLQYLSLTDWRRVNRLPIPASEMTLSRLVHQGWIEIRGEDEHTEARLTEAGLQAMRSPI
jgi:hypothetical protein